ncbi:hypothetical protein [Actinomadura flavalba]|uniref:hypothetical protein n=1 Tax=Actinomadura flavalba TaxID=1120938 RepID=UPI000376AB7D|nr:hypothetical protein [Actinomadura flavalba]
MGLTAYAAGRPSALLVGVPGAAAVRLAAEAEVRRLGWASASSPASASVLVVCGDPGPSLAAAIDAAWNGVPSPRADVRLSSPGTVRAALADVPATLADLPGQRASAVTGSWRPPAAAEPEHGHGHHMTGAVHGLAMAERADDRDGLKLDVLHLPFGPVLPYWPDGLQIRMAVQGDVVQSAEAAFLDPSGPDFWDEPGARRRAAAHLDALARLLGVAGWRAQAERARLLRDAALDGTPAATLLPRATRFARRVARSRTLRWMTDGLGVHARLLARLDATTTALAHLDDPEPLPPEPDVLGVLPSLLAGRDLAAARLIVAALDPRP